MAAFSSEEVLVFWSSFIADPGAGWDSLPAWKLNKPMSGGRAEGSSR